MQEEDRRDLEATLRPPSKGRGTRHPNPIIWMQLNLLRINSFPNIQNLMTILKYMYPTWDVSQGFIHTLHPHSRNLDNPRFLVSLPNNFLKNELLMQEDVKLPYADTIGPRYNIYAI